MRDIREIPLNIPLLSLERSQRRDLSRGKLYKTAGSVKWGTAGGAATCREGGNVSSVLVFSVQQELYKKELV